MALTAKKCHGSRKLVGLSLLLTLCVWGAAYAADCGYTTLFEKCDSPDQECPDGGNGPEDCIDTFVFFNFQKCPLLCTAGEGNLCEDQAQTTCFTHIDCEWSSLLDKCKQVAGSSENIPDTPRMNTGAECTIM